MATSGKSGGGSKPANLRQVYSEQIKDLGKLRTAGAEARERAQTDESRRVGAANILDPKQVASGKAWTPSKVLETTLGTSAVVSGQQSVALTGKQIRAFRDNIKTAQRNFRGGITAMQVLDFAAAIDKQRAQKEIRVSMPRSARGGRVDFLTSASLKYKETRHHVTVEFLSYEAAVAGAQGSPLAMARWLRQEPLKFDCDCGRHAFFYRYISTIGAFNAGRPETGYPKTTNPTLTGVACKHVVRTMTEIMSSAHVVGFLSKLIEKGRAAARPSSIKKTTNKITQREMEEQAARMFKRPRKIIDTAGREAAAERAAISKALKDKVPGKRAAGASRAVALSKDAKAAAQALAKAMGIPAEDVLKLLQGKKG